MFAVTGANGKLGSRIASRLAKLGVPQKLIVRNPALAPDLPGAVVAPVSAYSDSAGMKRALSGVGTLFLVSAHDRMGVAQNAAIRGVNPPPYDRVREQIAAVDAAVAAGVHHIVYLSFLNAAMDATFVLARDHVRTEDYIRSSGISFTFLRPCLYTDAVPLRVSDDGVIRAPAGNGRAAWVTRDDIADVAAAVITGDGHEGRTYDVTGPEALTMSETAAILSEFAGRRILYKPQTPEEARIAHTTTGMAEFEAERMALTSKGLEADEVEIWVTHYLQIAAGDMDTVSDTVPVLTGHPAQSLTDYLRRHPESYQYLVDKK